VYFGILKSKHVTIICVSLWYGSITEDVKN